jgi:hypothetical protein
MYIAVAEAHSVLAFYTRMPELIPPAQTAEKDHEERQLLQDFFAQLASVFYGIAHVRDVMRFHYASSFLQNQQLTLATYERVGLIDILNRSNPERIKAYDVLGVVEAFQIIKSRSASHMDATVQEISLPYGMFSELCAMYGDPEVGADKHFQDFLDTRVEKTPWGGVIKDLRLATASKGAYPLTERLAEVNQHKWSVNTIVPFLKRLAEFINTSEENLDYGPHRTFVTTVTSGGIELSVPAREARDKLALPAIEVDIPSTSNNKMGPRAISLLQIEDGGNSLMAVFQTGVLPEINGDFNLQNVGNRTKFYLTELLPQLRRRGFGEMRTMFRRWLHPVIADKLKTSLAPGFDLGLLPSCYVQSHADR